MVWLFCTLIERQVAELPVSPRLECQRSCAGNRNCQFWKWRKKGMGFCYLMSDLDRVDRGTKMFVSGSRDCVLPEDPNRVIPRPIAGPFPIPRPVIPRPIAGPFPIPGPIPRPVIPRPIPRPISPRSIPGPCFEDNTAYISGWLGPWFTQPSRDEFLHLFFSNLQTRDFQHISLTSFYKVF